MLPLNKFVQRNIFKPKGRVKVSIVKSSMGECPLVWHNLRFKAQTRAKAVRPWTWASVSQCTCLPTSFYWYQFILLG